MKNWEKQFDKEWNTKWETGTTMDGDEIEIDRVAIKSFISTLLSTTRTETLQECVEVLEETKMHLDKLDDPWNQALFKAQQKIAELKKRLKN